MMAKTLSETQIDEARQLLSNGMSWRTLCQRFKMHYVGLRSLLEPDYARQRNRRRRDLRANQTETRDTVERRAVLADAARRIAEIPDDTRSLTAVLCGDPIPNDPRRQF